MCPILSFKNHSTLLHRCTMCSTDIPNVPWLWSTQVGSRLFPFLLLLAAGSAFPSSPLPATTWILFCVRGILSLDNIQCSCSCCCCYHFCFYKVSKFSILKNKPSQKQEKLLCLSLSFIFFKLCISIFWCTVQYVHSTVVQYALPLVHGLLVLDFMVCYSCALCFVYRRYNFPWSQ